MKKETLKILRLSLILALIFSLLISCARFEAGCEELKENVVRLHIKANSNLSYDQELKLRVRDEILKATESNFANANSKDDALMFAKTNISEFKRIADSVIQENGYDYQTNVRVEKTYFSTREYEGFTLPAGWYQAVCIDIGEAKGENWWCVMYPAVCVSASADFNSLGNNAQNVASGKQKYVFRFKTVEIFEEIKNFLKKYK